MPSRAQNRANEIEPEAKRRRKLVTSGTRRTETSVANRRSPGARQETPASTARRESGFVDGAQPELISSRLMNKHPSVYDMNAALKTNETTPALLENIAASGPRPLQIGRKSNNDGFIPSSPGMAMSETVSTFCISTTTAACRNSQNTQKTNITHGTHNKSIHPAEVPSQMVNGNGLAWSTMDEDVTLPTTRAPRNSLFAGATCVPEEDDEDSIMSDASVSANTRQSWMPTQPRTNIQQPLVAALSPKSLTQNSAGLKHTGPFSEEEEHLLIFLKEVKKLQWRLITDEFAKDFPGRAYHTLQTRYTTKTNKRDRTQDPAMLNLPSRWAAEAIIDWTSVHNGNPGPSKRVDITNLRRDASTASRAAPRPPIIRQLTENEDSSGTDSGVRQSRPRRAPVVNYDVRRQNRRLGFEGDGIDIADTIPLQYMDTDSRIRSESPRDAQTIPEGKAYVVLNEPLDMHFDADDASIALIARKGTREVSSRRLPYLDASQRLSLQNAPEGWDWDQLSSRDWQGSILHVDFSPLELELVERAVTGIQRVPQKPRHSTQRRQLRTALRDLPDPKLLQLSHTIHRCLLSRDRNSILAFLQDARAGKIPEAPQILRLAAARSSKYIGTTQVESTLTMVRQRELGSQSRRGWKTASKPLVYQTRNKVMDTLGPLSSWTGASSDIHTVAWSPDGEHFAAGAVAVTDQDSMQYNRANNLLYGILTDSTIHELAEHSTERQKTEKGANSSHAMFVSQDPRLYTTVTSVAFSRSGTIMYSAGYDESVCVWDIESASSQPSLAAKLRHKAEVELMVVNRNYAGVLSTAAKKTSGTAVKLITLNEDNPAEFAKHNFSSAKATSRSDLRILPQALQFEPRYGEMLLAGFGANVREDNGFDTTGDLCLWDITTQTQFAIHGSSRNVFDVAFNPNRSSMPLFAAACVAGGNVNRGTRSIIRLYEERTAEKYSCPLEIECRALDMNDLVWSPQDEHIIAAGCTDGCVYVWDMRHSDDPLRVLTHGRSLMPLHDNIHHERTDTGVRFLSWGENATRLYSGSSDGIVKVWDVTRSEEDTFIKDLITADSGIMAGAFSSDYTKLILGEVNGSVNVLDVGRDDYTIKDVDRLRYIPYEVEGCEQESVAGDSANIVAHDSGVAEGNYLLQNQQLQLAPMGNLPINQVVQGPNYSGPFDQGTDAPCLRDRALQFQLSMATPSSPQCSIAACQNNMIMVTSEETGDSHRSVDRIPDELRVQWKAINTVGIVPGKSKCSHCSRPARSSSANVDPDGSMLCERCSFTCFRCTAVNPIAAASTTLICDFCAGVWEMGALGYECVEQPTINNLIHDVPSLRRFGRDMLEERWEEEKTSFGDEMNALTDYYHSLAIDRPESTPL
jgi:WD40 repeat protein